MKALRRAISFNASALAARQARTSITRSRLLSASGAQFRAYSLSSPRRQQAFQSQIDSSPRSSVLQSSLGAAPANPQTLTEKIVQLHADGLREGRKVKAGDYITLRHMEMGATSVKDNRQVVMTLDHAVQDTSEQNLRKYRLIEEFANTHGIDFSTSTVFWQIPPTVKITFTGILPPGVTGKDTIIALCALLNKDDVLNMCVEFTGSEQTLASIPISERLTIANMTTEWGALSGLFPVDDKLISWYRARATLAAMADSPTKDRINHERIDKLLENPMVADPGAKYAKECYFNLSTLSPFVAGPNSVKVANPVKNLEAQDIAVDKAYLLSCTNGRSQDFAAAACVFREAGKDGKPAKVHPRVKFYLAPASLAEQKMAEDAGDWQVLEQSGAQLLPAGCGPCIGLGLLEEGEVGISASNRNYKGRMRSPKALCYLASPEVVAASAIQVFGEGSGDFVADKARAVGDAFGKILGEMESLIGTAEGAAEESASPAVTEEETLTTVVPGFPERIEGEIVFCDNDNINTDGIYPGKYTYQDDMTTEQMAKVCMENYDTEFGSIIKPNDVLIPLVVAGSFGNIFSRNSINNALLGIEIPKLIERLREAYKDDAEKPLTRRTGWKLLWDVRRSKVTITEQDGSSWEQKVGEMPPSVQEIVAKGGVLKWVQSKMQA
ncbi:hypothetical protein V8C34DRAFT_302880 [Trichoderma compactum]